MSMNEQESQNNYLSKREVYQINTIEQFTEVSCLKITTSQRERFITHRDCGAIHGKSMSQNNYLSKREVYLSNDNNCFYFSIVSQNNYLSKREVYCSLELTHQGYELSQNNYLSKREVYKECLETSQHTGSQNNYLSKREVYVMKMVLTTGCHSLKITTSQRERFITIIWHMGHVVEASQNNYLSKREVYTNCIHSAELRAVSK